MNCNLTLNIRDWHGERTLSSDININGDTDGDGVFDIEIGGKYIAEPNQRVFVVTEGEALLESLKIKDGGGGSDQVSGGGGRDVLTGGRGVDALTGGGGADLFQFQTSDRRDTITDLEQGRDKIEIVEGAGAFKDLVINQQGDDVLIAFSNVQIVVEDDSVAAFAADDFIF